MRILVVGIIICLAFVSPAWAGSTPSAAFEDQPGQKTLNQVQKDGQKLQAVVQPVLDINHILPLVKDRKWLTDVSQNLKTKGAKFSPLHDDLNAELVIVYAEDQPERTRFLDESEVRMDKPALRALAIKNLRKTLPRIELHQAGPVGYLTAGGDYEASLLLLDDIWSDGQIKMNGETIVAIPGHDTLLVAGSGNPEDVPKFREMVKSLGATARKPLTNTLFIYRSGKFIAYDKN